MCSLQPLGVEGHFQLNVIKTRELKTEARLRELSPTAGMRYHAIYRLTCPMGHVHMMSAWGTPNADAVRKLSKGGCVEMQIGRGREVKKSENFADVICPWLLTVMP